MIIIGTYSVMIRLHLYFKQLFQKLQDRKGETNGHIGLASRPYETRSSQHQIKHQNFMCTTDMYHQYVPPVPPLPPLPPVPLVPPVSPAKYWQLHQIWGSCCIPSDDSGFPK